MAGVLCSGDVGDLDSEMLSLQRKMRQLEEKKKQQEARMAQIKHCASNARQAQASMRIFGGAE